MWSKTSGVEPGCWDLRYAGVKAAALVWCHAPRLEHWAMDRIVDALNLPAAECAPSLDPVWRFQRLTPHRWWGSTPQVVEVMVGTTVAPDALVVWWEPQVRAVGNWSQRIADALNSGRHGARIDLAPPAAGRMPLLSGPLEHEEVPA